ncbi:MAG: 3-deoxy-7-phosphoheptulonate synthase [Chloroflexota bacterium]|nr:3-deoxy-7-phosphoheptulonate synthase [Chloroflexota bacterium]
MIVVMQAGASDKAVDEVVERIVQLGLNTNIIRGTERTIIGVIGTSFKAELAEMLASAAEVDSIIPVSKKYKLASREFNPVATVVELNGGLTIGGSEVVVIVGPGAVESEEQLVAVARAAKEAGGHILKGDVFKPRASPYAFRGLGLEGLKMLAKVREELAMPILTEVHSTEEIELATTYADIILIGPHNMQNFNLLEEVGRTMRPVMIQRGNSATIEEWLLAAEYALNTGNKAVILCEGGIRSFDPSTRAVLDLAVIPLVKKLSHLPIVVNPSQATGKGFLVPPMGLAAIAAGADGLIIEVHPHPDQALAEGPESLTIAEFEQMITQVKNITRARKQAL